MEIMVAGSEPGSHLPLQVLLQAGQGGSQAAGRHERKHCQADELEGAPLAARQPRCHRLLAADRAMWWLAGRMCVTAVVEGGGSRAWRRWGQMGHEGVHLRARAGEAWKDEGGVVISNTMWHESDEGGFNFR